jgi:hypothetical protein
MDTIFTLGLNNDDDDNETGNVKLNLDDLYEKKKQYDLNTLATYNKILARVHNKIKTVSRQNKNEQFCWYVIPEVIIGVPRYDHGACTAYLIDKLRSDNLYLKYTHPNLLLISWKHWIPGYVRQEYKKKMGVAIDGFGNEIDPDAPKNPSSSSSASQPDDPNDLMFMHNKNYTGKIGNEKGSSKEYTPIDTYKPSGNLIYNEGLLKTIEEKSRR